MVRENDMPDALQWDLADRLHKSLRVSDIPVKQVADFLEVHRNTVGSWLSGRARPNPANMRLWAEHTGFPYEWLRGDKWPGEGQSVANDDQAELPAAEWLREISAAHQQISAALQQIADQLEQP